jgi:AraC-like DNA-binding protein
MANEIFSVGLPARFLSAGRCTVPGGWNTAAPVPDAALLIVRDAGSAAGKEAAAPDSRQALLLPPGSSAAEVPAGFVSAGPAVWLWLRFRSVSLPAATQVHLSLLPVSLHEDAFNRLAYGFHQLIRAGEGCGGSSDLCDYMLSVLLLSLRDEGRRISGNAVAARMLDYIRLHCYERLTLPDVARALGYSEDYLSRLLHDQVSCSFRQYIHYLRMQRAKKELISGIKPIQEIAEECGYSNAKFFSTSFLKCEGLAPSAFRNLYAAGFRQDCAES